jgi:hypothetical protein
MRVLARTRLIWFSLGLVLGGLITVLHAAWQIWPLQEDVILHWVRWAGKETVKWGYVGVIFAIVAFLVMQLLNAFFATRRAHQEEPHRR